MASFTISVNGTYHAPSTADKNDYLAVHLA